jgi:beta-lactamase class A
MVYKLRIATLFVALLLFISACAETTTQVVQPTATVTPTAIPPTAVPTPEPTPVPPLAQGIRIAGIDVGGLDRDAAYKKLSESLAALSRPLDLRIGDTQLTFQLDEIDFEPAFDAMLDAAQQAAANTRVPLDISYDADKLRERLETIAADIVQLPTLKIITDTETISRSFALVGGAELNVDAALEQIDKRLRQVGGSRRVTLDTRPTADGIERPSPKELQEQLELLAEEWKGIVGVYVHDLESGEELVSLNKDTAFTAASTIKVAIMLNAFINVPELDDDQLEALELMIVESDNLKANDLMAAAVGGTTTEAAFEGAEQMSDMLADLGLPNTFLYVAFESNDFIKLYNIKYRVGPARGGKAPFTPASTTLRTTPFEMAQIYVYLEECSRGEGVLLEKYGKNLSAERCQEMIDWLEKNGDHTRMMSGLPPDAKVAHKSGWIPPEIQADAGIVRSPGGDFILSVFLYQDKEYFSDAAAERMVGHIARLIYSYYNPAPAEE